MPASSAHRTTAMPATRSMPSHVPELADDAFVADEPDNSKQLKLLRKVVSEDCLTVTVPEAAQLLGIHVDSAYDAAHRGKLPMWTSGPRGRMAVLKFPLLRMLGVEAEDLRRFLAVIDQADDPSDAPLRPVESHVGGRGASLHPGAEEVTA